jgi:hypothetical protein
MWSQQRESWRDWINEEKQEFLILFVRYLIFKLIFFLWLGVGALKVITITTVSFLIFVGIKSLMQLCFFAMSFFTCCHSAKTHLSRRVSPACFFLLREFPMSYDMPLLCSPIFFFFTFSPPSVPALFFLCHQEDMRHYALSQLVFSCILFFYSRPFGVRTNSFPLIFFLLSLRVFLMFYDMDGIASYINI